MTTNLEERANSDAASKDDSNPKELAVGRPASGQEVWVRAKYVKTAASDRYTSVMMSGRVRHFEHEDVILNPAQLIRAACQREAARVQAEARERLAAWMIEHSFSTGHGDTFEDLLKELSWQVKELRQTVRMAALDMIRTGKDVG